MRRQDERAGQAAAAPLSLRWRPMPRVGLGLPLRLRLRDQLQPRPPSDVDLSSLLDANKAITTAIRAATANALRKCRKVSPFSPNDHTTIRHHPEAE